MVLAHRNIVYRVLPGNRTTARRLAAQAGACRFVWNEILARHNAAYRNAVENGGDSPSTSFFSLGKEFTKLRADVDWLSQHAFNVTRYVLKYQSDAWAAHFRGHGERPTFRSKYGSTPSFTIPEDIRIRGNRLHVPRIGAVVLRRKGGNPYSGDAPCKAVLKEICGKWYATVTYKVDVPEREDDGTAIGIDMNVGQVACVDLEGNEDILHKPDTADIDRRINRLRNKESGQRKGAKRRLKTRQRIRRLERKRANVRKNWSHRISRRIAGNYSTVCVEDLKIDNMTKSAGGTVEKPGRNVRQKSGLNRKILDTGWGILRQCLEYKTSVVKVPSRYTSQRCSSCGTVDSRSRLSQSNYLCVACGYMDNADLNAARNILASGIGVSGRGKVAEGHGPSKRCLTA